MKVMIGMLLGLGLTLALATGSYAEEKTLEGTVTCAKCDLKKADKCHTVIKVKEGDKEVIYWFDTASSKKFHKEICNEAKEGKVTGTVKKDGDKMVITATKVDYK